MLPDVAEIGQEHAADRLQQQFTLGQMAAEYRGLRNSVTRRWIDSLDRCGTDELNEIARFDRALDLSMGVAIAWYDDRLRTTQEVLRTNDRAKDEFLAVLGHELRNPLAPLRTGLSLLDQVRSKPELLDTLQPMMERQFSHLLRLVDDLLDTARISRGEIVLQPAALDLNDAVRAAVEQLMPVIRQQRHELKLELTDAALPVDGDSERLVQVVANLLSNAAKYMDPGGTITVVTESGDAFAAVRVRDTGYGIPPERAAGLFELFTQVPEHRRLSGGGGLGVGLALSRQLVEMHGGRIEATSAGLGRGSEFVVTLPLSRARHPAETGGAAAADTGPRRRVLVVDDNADAADTLRTLIEVMGHTVEAAYDGTSVLERIDEFAPDVVLLDLRLPDVDGVEVARRIRSRPGGDRIVLIALSGWTARGEYLQRIEEAGFDEELTKPVDAQQIRTILASL